MSSLNDKDYNKEVSKDFQMLNIPKKCDLFESDSESYHKSPPLHSEYG